MLPSPAELQFYAKASARRSVILLAGGVMAAIGAGFLLAAVWTLLAEAFSSLVASLAIAGLMLGLGVVMILTAPPKPVLPGPAQRLRNMGAHGQVFTPGGKLPPLMEALLFGFSVALQVRARKR